MVYEFQKLVEEMKFDYFVCETLFLEKFVFIIYHVVLWL